MYENPFVLDNRVCLTISSPLHLLPCSIIKSLVKFPNIRSISSKFFKINSLWILYAVERWIKGNLNTNIQFLNGFRKRNLFLMLNSSVIHRWTNHCFVNCKILFVLFSRVFESHNPQLSVHYHYLSISNQSDRRINDSICIILLNIGNSLFIRIFRWRDKTKNEV